MQRCVWLMFSATVLSACAGTSTGNPFDPNEANRSREIAHDPCETPRTTQLALDADSLLGISAVELLALANTPPAGVLAWAESNDQLRVGPESGTSALSITVSAASDHARLIEFQGASGNNESGDGTLGSANCPRRLELDVQVHIETAGGALNETFETVLEATSPRVAMVPNAKIPATQLQGSLTVERPGSQWTGVVFSMRFTELGSAGWIDLTSSEPASPDSKGATEGEITDGFTVGGAIAHWPVDCVRVKGLPTTLDRRIQGMNALDAIELINAARLQLQLPGAPRTELQATFSADADLACAVDLGPPSDPLRLFVQGKLHVQSGDGQIDGDWSVGLSAQPSSDGTLGLVKVAYDPIFNLPAELVDADKFEASHGWHGVDLMGAKRVGIEIEISRSPGSPARGEVTLYTATEMDCSSAFRAAQSDPKAGGFGCASVSLTPLLMGEISE
jgi:hypothetical protein